MTFKNLFAPVLIVALHVLAVCGFMPAQPSNATTQEFDAATTSRLSLQWYSNGSDWSFLSHRLVPADTNGSNQGILVHFSEDYAVNEPTTTPWIAFVSCDANFMNSSQEIDIFTKAKDLGAQAAVLYSIYSETCVLDAEYLDLATTKQDFDIFATLTVQASRRIEHDFGQLEPLTPTYYKRFNATILNGAASAINLSTTNQVASPGFLLATIHAFNDTGTAPTISMLQADTNVTTTPESTGSSQTGIAMIVLYAITGFVSALFCCVIISGAIKAIRHPERYGPRAHPAQSRARGLGRAILDTFPVVKFRPAGSDRESSIGGPKDVESSPATITPSRPAARPSSLELGEMDRAAELHAEQGHDSQGSEAGVVAGSGLGEGTQASPGADQDHPPPSTAVDGGVLNTAASVREQDTRMPESIGRETCPICIVDFEEGDDLRVLPCEGKHRFHQACVDPWLLELSGSCPICREDFHALEAIISGEPEGAANHEGRASSSSSAMQGRLSRYLRFARVRQQRRGSRHHDGPTSDASL